MKLKKIASLMLAGVMAVSMLAGCSGKSNDDNNNGQENNGSQATGVAATFASYLSDKDTVTFTDGDNGALLKKATDKVVDTTIDSIYKNSSVNQVSNGEPFTTINGTIVSSDEITDLTAGHIKNYLKNDDTYIAVYSASGDMDQKYVLAKVAKELNGSLDSDNLPKNSIQKSVTKPGDTYYNFTYTGTVDMFKAETKDGDSSAWYVLVVLNVDATSAEMPKA